LKRCFNTDQQNLDELTEKQQSANNSYQDSYYVPASNIVGLKTNQKMRFTANQNVTQPMVLDGIVREIGTATIASKEGSFYKCVAALTVSRSQRDNMKYGINGRVTVIKGKKTWAQYYKDKVMGDRND